MKHYTTLYTNGKWISTAKLKSKSAQLKLQEIAMLEEYISKCKSETWQRIAGNRMNLLIKEISR